MLGRLFLLPVFSGGLFGLLSAESDNVPSVSLASTKPDCVVCCIDWPGSDMVELFLEVCLTGVENWTKKSNVGLSLDFI